MDADAEFCGHGQVKCLNHYEIIRKYKCLSCAEVMMCACEQDIALDFLPHQIRKGQWYGTGIDEAVTAGFVEGICEECRGESPTPHPAAEIFGRTSKFDRYYWRELHLEPYRKMRAKALEMGLDSGSALRANSPAIARKITEDTIAALKESHRLHPKYIYNEPSQADILDLHGVSVVRLDATYVDTPQARSQLVGESALVSVEEFAAEQYRKEGWLVVFCESQPFHAMFGILLRPLIEDPSDDGCRIVGIVPRGSGGEVQYSNRPFDFGKPGYSLRRREAIDEYFKTCLQEDTEELLWAFDYLSNSSLTLATYLHATEPSVIAKARQIIELLPASIVLKILRVLLDSYWKRFCGWPDLLLIRNGEFAFTEVKGSKDKLSQDQKAWIATNATHLSLPFWLTKVHKAATLSMEEYTQSPNPSPN